ncbi:MAG: hypothetical protein KDB03_23965 [Planctomycetales bacterium]|nr:hypothetical protein [Planctomycetales bacterium]
MAIQVTCPGCLKRFTVSDKFAGKSGPCPSCQKVIKIPDKTQEVVIHAPEESGPKDSKGKSILKPIRRKEFNVSMPVMLAIGLSTMVVVGLALGFRLSATEPPNALLAIAVIGLALPLVMGGYWFLQDDELEGFSRKELWVRSGICAVLFALTWGLYVMIPKYVNGHATMAEFTGMDMLIMFPIMMAVGISASVLIFELELVQGVLHYTLYLGATLLLGLLSGADLAEPFSGGSAAPGISPPSQMVPAEVNPGSSQSQETPANVPKLLQ